MTEQTEATETPAGQGEGGAALGDEAWMAVAEVLRHSNDQVTVGEGATAVLDALQPHVAALVTRARAEGERTGYLTGYANGYRDGAGNAQFPAEERERIAQQVEAYDCCGAPSLCGAICQDSAEADAIAQGAKPIAALIRTFGRSS